MDRSCLFHVLATTPLILAAASPVQAQVVKTLDAQRGVTISLEGTSVGLLGIDRVKPAGHWGLNGFHRVESLPPGTYKLSLVPTDALPHVFNMQVRFTRAPGPDGKDAGTVLFGINGHFKSIEVRQVNFDAPGAPSGITYDDKHGTFTIAP